MRYYKPISFALMFLILAVLALCLAPGCALLQIGQPQYKTFELTIAGEKVVVNLPNELPSMDQAIYGQEMCWDTKLCAQEFCLNDEIIHGHIRFFYSDKNVVALGWLNEEGNDRQWLYEEGLPTEVDYAQLKAFLDSLWKKVPNQ